MRGPCVALLLAAIAAAAACEGTGGLSGGSSGSSSGGPDAAHDGGFDAGAPDAPDTLSKYREVVMADGPVAYYRLGESAGPSAKDETGAHPASYGGPVTFGVPGAIANDPDTAVEFDGQSNNLSPGNVFDFDGTSSYSLEIWVKPTLLDTQYRMLFKHDGSSDAGRQEFGVWLTSNGTGAERYVNGGPQAAEGVALTLDAWTHVVATYDGSALTLFVNGVAVQVVQDTRSAAPKNEPFWIGGTSQVGYGVTKGAIDEAAVYDKPLPPNRVLAHFQAAK